MSGYLCYLVNPGNRIVDIQDIVAGTEAEAVEKVRTLVAQPPGPCPAGSVRSATFAESAGFFRYFSA